MKTISNGITFMKNGKFIKLYETIYDRFKQGHGLLEGDVVKLKDGYKTSEHYKALPTSIQVRLEDSEKSGYNLRVGRLHTPNAQYGSMGYVALPATHADLYQERAPGAFGNLVTVPIGLLEPIDTGVNLPPVSKKNKRSGKEAPYQKPSKKSKNKDAVTDEQTDVGEKQNYAKKGDYKLATKNKKPSVGANSYDDSKPSTNYKPLAKNGKKPKTLKESMENIENIYMSILNEDVELEPNAEVDENSGLKHLPPITINNKEVDYKSLELDGVDMSDFPDFVDAFIVSGSFKDGTKMSADEIDKLNVEWPEITQELAHDSLHEADDNNEVNQEDQFAQVEELLKSFNDRMIEVGAYGEPNRAKVYGAIRNGDFKTAAEEICYSYHDQDGGEVDVQGHIGDIESELNYIFNNQELNEVDQEDQFAQVEELLKSFNDRMIEVGAYGEPNRAKVYNAIRNGDFKGAAEEICYSYHDQDGGEVDVQGHIGDIESELKYIFNNQELNEWESDDTDPESRPRRPDTHHVKGDVPRLASNTLHAKSGKIIPKDTPLSDWEELNEGDIEESMVKPECWNKETNAVIDECWNEDGSMKQDCWNEDTSDTTGTTSEVTQNPEEMEQTGPL